VTARDELLERVRAARAGAAPRPVPRTYVQHGASLPSDVVDAFVDRVRDYGATVVRSDHAPTAVQEAVRAEQGARIGVPPDLDAALHPRDVDVIGDAELSAAELDGLDGALTACSVACAATGTIALDGGPGQGRRALTLVPDLHVCVVRESQIVETVPELVRRLEPAAREGRPIVLVSGPSATSDIELDRVEGVHGPRRRVVIVER
jgi:L-lactate dehydrogenase complex protein LldG